MEFELNGHPVVVEVTEGSLLDALHGELGCRDVKDGCSPQGQCGCCTVWVDGAPRVACVTPVRRVAGRKVVTPDGLDADTRRTWGDAFCATGASQCGFCSPGIVMRLEGARRKGGQLDDATVVRGLAAHVCRCTGYQTIVEAAALVAEGSVQPSTRDLAAAERRAELEGGAAQQVGTRVTFGDVGFPADDAPAGCEVHFSADGRRWTNGATRAEARRRSGAVQGRNSTASIAQPLEIPDVDGAVRRLATSWVEPAYLESDAAWVDADGTVRGPLVNGGAFGGKVQSAVLARLSDVAARPAMAVLSREGVVRSGAKRPPLALAVRADGTGRIRIAAVAGARDAALAVFPHAEVEEVDVAGPAVAMDIRRAVWAELAAVRATLADADTVSIEDPHGGRADVAYDASTIRVVVDGGDALDEVVLRSYCIGAVHMGFGHVWSEGLAVDETGEIADLTFRSYGLVKPGVLPPIEVESTGEGPPRPVSDAVFAAAMGAAWRASGFPDRWPTGIPR